MRAKVLARLAWKPEFDSQNPLKGGGTWQSCPSPLYQCCDNTLTHTEAHLHTREIQFKNNYTESTVLMHSLPLVLNNSQDNNILNYNLFVIIVEPVLMHSFN